MRLTIERIRTMVVLAGVLLVVALGVFLTVGKIKSKFNRHDLPKRLGIDIQQEANGFTHAEFRAGRATFKITASKVEQLKDGLFRLHQVKIEMYSPNDTGADSIEGNEFEYDQKAGIARAAGPVAITITKPKQASGDQPPQTAADKTEKQAAQVLAAAQRLGTNQIHVHTSGLSFDQKRGIASTDQNVDFSITQGSGSAVGATYDSQTGKLVLQRDVRLNTERSGDAVAMQADHAEFERGEQLCRMASAVATYRGGRASATDALLHFRDDGTAERLDVTRGVAVDSATGGHLAAPTGSLVFNTKNRPTEGHLEGGVTIDSEQEGRKTHGTAPSARLQFNGAGVLERIHMEQGVDLVSDESSMTHGTPFSSHREWRSPIADLTLRDADHGRLELAQMEGHGGVLVTGETRRGTGPVEPSRLSADSVTGIFGPDSALSELRGAGHASILETAVSGTRQTTSGDQVEAHFAADGRGKSNKSAQAAAFGGATQIASAIVTGHVVLVQEASATESHTTPTTTRAMADRAVYEGAGGQVHLAGSPRVESGGLQFSADSIDFARSSGDAFAYGNVKATWIGNSGGLGGSLKSASKSPAPGFGGDGPAHVIAAEAQLHQATNQATFRGNARLWQAANSIAAPLIVLDRTKQTLLAKSTDPSEPVRVVMVSAAGAGAESGRTSPPSVIRIRGGDLKYSDAERKATMIGGPGSHVTAQSGDALSESDQVDLSLLPSGAQKVQGGANTQVERLTAQGHVAFVLQGRRGRGEKLEYTSATGNYVLTGSPSSPPRMSDPARGEVTGEALIFNSRDDSVSVEGGGRKTLTETSLPKRP